ncbi:MAG: hypothetical protein QOH76_2607, partial [Thermoleophilaceae bacterium]|nr:hypothetical protein [Thermoleophilaceae bacterium]
SGQRTTSAVERYDIDRNRWKRVRPMPVGLNHTAATAYAGDLYVMGGYASKTGCRAPSTPSTATARRRTAGRSFRARPRNAPRTPSA